MLSNFDEIRTDLDTKKAENLRFIEYIIKIGEAVPYHTSKSINALAKAFSNEIDCTKCGNCCRSITIHINAEDRRRLATWLKITEKEFLDRYCRKTDQGWAFTDLQCPFLENRSCTAYEVRPQVCRQFPNLDLEMLCLNGVMPVNMFDMLKSAYRCPITYNVFEELKKVYSFHQTNDSTQSTKPAIDQSPKKEDNKEGPTASDSSP